MPQKTLLGLFLTISSLGLTLGCHHAKPVPYIDPTREISAPNTTLEEEQEDYRDTKNKEAKQKISDAKIPVNCVTDLDQSHSDCKLIMGHPDTARCDGVVIHFGCLSYRNQMKAVQPRK